MRKIMLKIAAAVFAAAILAIGASAETDTDGYILISTPDDLLAIGDDLTANYRLANDIDLKETAFTPIGSIEEPFSGIFDGANNTIYNATIDVTSDDIAYSAFFVMSTGTIKNTTFQSCTVNANGDNSAYAAVVCALNKGTIKDISAMLSKVEAVSGSFVARAATFAAYNFKSGTLFGCFADAEVNAKSKKLYADAASIAAVNLGEIEQCDNCGDVTSTSIYSDATASGLACSGYGTVINSTNYGDITAATATGRATVSGTVSSETATVTGCSNEGTTSTTTVEASICGDINGDGLITPADNILLARYVGKWNGYMTIDIATADLNGDGLITATDSIILTRYLSNWSGYSSLPIK